MRVMRVTWFSMVVRVSLTLASTTAGAATGLPKLEGWTIGYLGNQRENHSILLAAYHARGESSSQKTLRCILSTEILPLSSLFLHTSSLLEFCGFLFSLFLSTNLIVPTHFIHHKSTSPHWPSDGASIINNFVGSS